jgi:DNA-binding transcriptional MocR family regulator
MEELRRRLARARRTTAEKLRRIGVEPWLMPRGGYYLWCRLPDGCDSAVVARSALAENVVLAPGNVFSASQSAAAYMRFNVAQCGDPRAISVLHRAVKRPRI